MACDDPISRAVDRARRCAASVSPQYKTVEVVTRVWSGGRRGRGTPTESVLTLDPKPRVVGAANLRSDAAGTSARGTVRVHGVSRSYTKAALDPQVGEDTEVFYRVDGDAYRLASDPEETTTGWRFTLTRMQARP